MTHTYALQSTLQKSYYNKALIIEDTATNTIYLQSYTTKVAKYNPTTKTFTKLWNGYSRTTMNHIIDFCKLYNIDFTPNKHNWLNLPTDTTTPQTQTRYYIKGTNGITTHDFKNTLFDNYDQAQEYADNHTNDFWYYWVEEL